VSQAYGSDANNGSEAAPFATIDRALSVAATMSQHVDVKVATGYYVLSAPLQIGSNASLLGGYDGTNWSLRDPGTNVVQVLGNVNPLVNITSLSGDIVVDGFNLESGASGGGSSVVYSCITAVGSPTISHDYCTMPIASSDQASGILYQGSGTPAIVDNMVVINNPATTVVGIQLGTAAGGLVARNVVYCAGTDGSNVGIEAVSPSGLVIDSNLVDVAGGGPSTKGNAGIAFTGTGNVHVTNNTVHFGAAGTYAAFGIGDYTGAGAATITYGIANNIVFSNQVSGAQNCVQISAASHFTFLNANDLFACFTGLVDVGSANGTGGTEYTTAAAVNGLPGATYNLNFPLIVGGSPNTYFVNDTGDFRLQAGQLGVAGFLGVKQGGLVVSSSGGIDLDGNPRPAGRMNTFGEWSMGAYQQDY
jgi:hypothetical protein